LVSVSNQLGGDPGGSVGAPIPPGVHWKDVQAVTGKYEVSKAIAPAASMIEPAASMIEPAPSMIEPKQLAA
jgi:hypothetical protein